MRPKLITTSTHNNSLITTIVDDYDTIWQTSSNDPGWVRLDPGIKEEEISPLEAINQKTDFDTASLKKAYVQGIISSQDLYAENPYSATTPEFKLWFEGRAYALTSS